MSGEAEAEAARPRPLSGGLWTLFSWLRRDDACSSESISSAGSDRTAVSFAFLARPPSRLSPHPAPLSPPSPPSDTYKKRVRDRNLRRQHDRNLTLHSKYGLYRCDGSYDALSLPFARRGGDSEDRQERERRATSECGRLRAAHVPGKRRAPPPPAATASLGRRRTRKRPAPLPPVPVQCKDTTKENKSPEEDKINILVNMNSKSDPNRRSMSTREVSTGCRSEKYSKKDGNTTDAKPRTEKSFLKQIFENRKRNSAIESFPGKILPSISELDKQAAEIIESCKLRALEPNSDFTSSGSPSSENTWFCTRCLRKYNSTVVTCPYCLPEQQKLASVYGSVTRAKASSIYTQTTTEVPPNVAATSRLSAVGIDEKQKLKEMLKEMKDSLPKRPKHEKSDKDQSKNRDTAGKKEMVLETPTLRIGSIIHPEVYVSPSTSQQTIVKHEETPTKEITVNYAQSNSATETVIITQPVVLVAPVVKNSPPITHHNRNNGDIQNTEPSTSLVNSNNEINNTSLKETKSESVTKENKSLDQSGNKRINIHTSLKISSLFNPVYIPKNSISQVQSPRSIFLSHTDDKNPQRQVKNEVKPIVSITSNEVQLAASSSPTTSQRDSSEAAPTSSKTDIKDEKDIFAKDQPQSSYKNKFAAPNTSVMLKDFPIAKESLPSQKNSNDALSAVSTISNSQSSNEEKPSNSNVVGLFGDQHARRRNLINQLEKSIAKGDEQAAAEAAVKLAQLKLSCSVLSFSSQIVGESAKVAAPSSRKVTTTNKTVDSTSKTFLIHSTTGLVPQRNVTINKTIHPKAKTPHPESSTRTAPEGNSPITSKLNDLKSTTFSQQPTSSAPETIIPTNKINDPKSKTPTQPSTKVNTSVQSMEIVSSKDKCKQNKAAKVGLKNDVPSPSASKQEASEKETGGNKNNAQQLLSLQPSTSSLANDNTFASIEVWVEDREATRGPVRLHVRREAVMGELRRQAEASLGLAVGLQRWIVGHALCTDDNTPLASLAGPDLAAPFYLCLVQSETNAEVSSAKAETERVDNEIAGNVYSELVQLERHALVPNAEPFECTVCMEECAVGRGAVLRDCVHAFCRNCISDLVRHCQEPDVSCPAMGCPGVLQEREIRGVVSAEEYEKWLARGLAAAESGTRNAFHCRTRDCTGWALCDPGVRRFPCPVCKHTNCVPCQAIHEGDSCEQHRLKLQEVANSKTLDTSQTDEGTRALLDTLITKGEALQCPECSAIITKKWGCDWVKCSACKTEICWVTRGRRWGPGGRGDTTGGCRCGVDGKRCHASCGYCH